MSSFQVNQWRAAAVLAAAVVATPAYAQATPRTLQIRASAEVLHDNNAARATKAEAQARGLAKAENIYTPSVQVILSKPVGSFNFQATGSLGYDFHQHNTRLNRERLAFSGTANKQLSRCVVSLASNFSRQQTDLAGLASLPTTEKQGVVNVETVNSMQLGGRCGSGVGFSPLANILRETGTNSNARRKFSNYRLMEYGVGVGYAQPTFGDLTLNASLRDLTYPNRTQIGNDEGYKQMSINASFTRNIGANLQGTVAVGYTNLDPNRAGQPKFKGVTWSGNLTATFADRLQVSVTTRRGAFPTLLSDASYAVNRSLAASAEFALTDRISLGGGYTQTKQRFVGDVQGTLTALKRSKADSFSASANYRMNDRLRFSIFGRHQKRKSDLTLFDYKDTAYGAKVSFGI